MVALAVSAFSLLLGLLMALVGLLERGGFL